MSLARDDRWLSDGLGRALAGAQVFWCNQPATVPATAPPSPLANVFADIAGTQPITQPVITDGFGHADAYMDESVFYTVVFYHPLFGSNPVVLPDQSVGGGGSSAASLIPFAGTPSGTINGTNRVFTLMNGSNPLTVLPTQATVWLNFPLIVGLGYTLALVGGQVQVTFANAPQVGDTLYAQGFIP